LEQHDSRAIYKLDFKKNKEPAILSWSLVLFGSVGQIRTDDLWVMSPTSYQTAPPRSDIIF